MQTLKKPTQASSSVTLFQCESGMSYCVLVNHDSAAGTTKSGAIASFHSFGEMLSCPICNFLTFLLKYYAFYGGRKPQKGALHHDSVLCIRGANVAASKTNLRVDTPSDRHVHIRGLQIWPIRWKAPKSFSKMLVHSTGYEWTVVLRTPHCGHAVELDDNP